MSAANHRERLVDFLATLPVGGSLPGQDRLQLDSLALLQIITYLETEYAIRLSGLQLDPDDLRSVERILALIEKHGAKP